MLKGRKNHALPYVKCLLCTYSPPNLPALFLRALSGRRWATGGDGVAVVSG